ncbi:MAG: DUF4058 family protein [Planctomycetota bacterium]|nr:DUF4058 family protein [Planctomycetota bacterium]
MPLHDWTRVPAGIFHAFHHRWISAVADALNGGLLPREYYALAEQQTGLFGPDVLTLQADLPLARSPRIPGGASPSGTVLMEPPAVRFTAQADSEFYCRKKSLVAVRHVSGDGVVAVIEIVSPGNKSGDRAFRAFVDKISQLLESGVHVLIVDPFPPSSRDPFGVHSAVWESLGEPPFTPPNDKPLTLAAYECDAATRAYIEPVAVGDLLPSMPLFLRPGGCVLIPLETTYDEAFQVQPERWRRVLTEGHPVA